MVAPGAVIKVALPSINTNSSHIAIITSNLRTSNPVIFTENIAFQYHPAPLSASVPPSFFPSFLSSRHVVVYRFKLNLPSMRA